MSAPLISVIIPVYNTSEFLPACLDSVIKQSFAELEIICIDDGSTDKSGDILRQYAEQDIRIILHSQENLGASAAKNRGLALSSGEFLMIVDSDDILLPDALLKMYEAIKRDEADIVHGSYICRHYATGQRYITTANRALKTESQVFQTLLDRSTHYDPWAKLFRKKLFVDHDLSWSESIRYSTDVLIVYQAFYFARRLRIIPDLVYEHTFLRPCSLTNSFSNETFVTDKVQTRADIANFLRSQGAWERYKDAICSKNNRLFKNALLYRMIVLAKGASPHSIKNIVIACKNNLPEFIITEKEIVRIIFRFLDENVFAIAGYSNVERMLSPTALMAPPLIGLKEPLRWCRFRVSDVVANLGVFHPPWQGFSDGAWRPPRLAWSLGPRSGRRGRELRDPSDPNVTRPAGARYRGRALAGVTWCGSGHGSPHGVVACSLGPR